MFDRVGDELVDEECQDRGLLRGNFDITGRDIEGDCEARRSQRPICLVGSMAGDDVDRRAAESLLVAEQVVDGRDRLDTTDSLSQVPRPRLTLVVTKLDREQRSDGL